MQYSTLLFATLVALNSPAYAQQAADGALVPFTSVLPACASQCGPLYDVQGGCTDSTCFCADGRLAPFNNAGTSGVSQVCGPASCTSATDLQAIKTWYSSFCGSSSGGTGGTPTTTSRGGTGTARPSGSASVSSVPNDNSGGGGGGGGGGGSWIDTHKRWLIMAIVIVIGLALLWVGAWFFRRRYLRKKEREIEMSPPVAWGPNQVHGGNGVSEQAGFMSGGAGGHHKEMARDSTISGRRLTKGKMGWFKANK